MQEKDAEIGENKAAIDELREQVAALTRRMENQATGH